MIYALGGVSGSGKTWLRSQHPTLRNLRVLDIQQFYRDAEQRGYTRTWQQALQQLEQELWQCLLQTSFQGDIVLEAFFKPGSVQRQRIEGIASMVRMPVVYIWCSAPRDVCWQRCAADPTATLQRMTARLNFIQGAEASCFLPIPAEAPEAVLGAALQQAPQQRPLYYGGIAIVADPF